MVSVSLGKALLTARDTRKSVFVCFIKDLDAGDASHSRALLPARTLLNGVYGASGICGTSVLFSLGSFVATGGVEVVAAEVEAAEVCVAGGGTGAGLRLMRERLEPTGTPREALN